MELSLEQKRLLMLYEFKLGSSAAEAARRINRAFGDGTVGRRTVSGWYEEFRNGNEDLTHKRGSVHSPKILREAVLEAIEEALVDMSIAEKKEEKVKIDGDATID
ncbi:hypothetical protein OSTOST_08143 [Ostertagia ostertagi]